MPSHPTKPCDDPFFSILTAARNAAATISRTIESVKAQRYQSYEHIIVDGASRDNTCAIIQSNVGAYPLRWLSEPDEGIADALSKALALCRGKYIIVLQADDRFSDGLRLEKASQVLHHETIDIFSAPVWIEHPERRRILFKPKRLLWWHHFKTIFPHQGCFVHRRIYARIGNYNRDFKIAMDYDFFYRALKIRPRVHFYDEPLAVMGGGGISSAREFLQARLTEEYRVQMLNETNPLWRISQKGFRCLYGVYKLRIKSPPSN